ncbi:MAG: hypothetical protein JW779_10415 [Candidatus Thorarchaeota archaeon]|nr:hypothetical protein [Candidatus Thorarchaeota archaeon]
MKRIDVVLQSLDTMHIGSGSVGLGGGPILAIQRSQGKPMIPGSTLRGKLRWNLTRLTPILRRVATGSLERYFSTFRNDASVVADFFGVEDYRGKLVISDGRLIAPTPTETLPGVRLDTTRRSVESGALFFHEVVSPGSRFAFEMILDVPDSLSQEDMIVDMFISLFITKTLEKEGLGRSRARIAIDLGEHESTLEEMKEALLRDDV